MSTEHKHHRLLDALRNLYSKVVLRALHLRMHSNNKTYKSNHHHDISKHLTRHIEHLTKVESPTKNGINTANTFIRNGDNQNNQNKRLITTLFDGFSKFLKSDKTHSRQYVYLSERLKKSAWTHIHSALRMARQGDKTSAKLHADIANSALKEASHYMPVEEYKVFCEEVTDALSEIKK